MAGRAPACFQLSRQFCFALTVPGGRRWACRIWSADRGLGPTNGSFRRWRRSGRHSCGRTGPPAPASARRWRRAPGSWACRFRCGPPGSERGVGPRGGGLLFERFAALVAAAAPAADDPRAVAIALWTNLHGIAALQANRSLRLVVPATDTRALLAQVLALHLA
ncbi:WHG domain-containing protein [Nocardia sp. R16R-3T]